MAFDPDSKKDLSRLRGAMTASHKKLEPFRLGRELMLRQYVGRNYSDDGAELGVPVNMIELAFNTYLRFLVAQNPRASVYTAIRKLKPMAHTLELGLDHLFDEIRFVDTIRTFVFEALTGLGVVKTGLMSGGTVEIGGVTHDVGQPFCDPVLLDDWVFDMSAERYEQVGFAANRTFIPFELLQESKIFDPNVIKDITPFPKYQDDDAGQWRSSNLGQSEEGPMEEFYEFIQTWDVWLPMEGLVVTLSDNAPGRALKVVEWSGPEEGPFILLGFGEVPGNIMPLSPISAGMDLHMILNKLQRKLSRQAERLKNVTTYTGAAHEDAERLKSSSDGEFLRVDNPGQIETSSYGGVDTNVFVFTQSLKAEFKSIMGNLDTLGGLSTQADTLGQERLLAGNASKRVSAMQDQVTDAVSRITRALAHFLVTDPLIQLPLVKRVGDIEIPVTLSAEEMETDILDADIRIEPYSMQHRSPGERANALMEIYERLLLPAQVSGELNRQSIGINYQQFLRDQSKLRDMPELLDMLQFAEPIDLDQGTGGGSERPLQAANTSRTNTRISRTDANPEQELLSQLSPAGSGNLPISSPQRVA